MERTITLEELKEIGCNIFSIKDNSIRGIHSEHIKDIKAGEKVLLDNYFTLIIE